MEILTITLLMMATYTVPGILWWCLVAGKCWYEGTPIRVEDLYSIPILMLCWPVWIITEAWQALGNFWEQRKLNQGQDHVPISKRVILQGRLSARVARALKEDNK